MIIMIIIIIVRINCYRATGRCGGNSPMLIKCNCLADYRVQPAQPAGGAGLGRVGYENINPPQKPAPNPPQPGNPTGYPAPMRGVVKYIRIFVLAT